MRIDVTYRFYLTGGNSDGPGNLRSGAPFRPVRVLRYTAGTRPRIGVVPPDLDTSKCFFHYTTREAAFEHILPEGYLRFSRYEDMRDPMENHEWFWGAAYFVPEGEPPEVKERSYFDFRNFAEAIRLRAHLLALTVDAGPEYGYGGGDENFGKGWARARMWEHYAENHAGVCLVFDKERLTKNLSDDIHRMLKVRPYDNLVEYTPDGRRGQLLLDLGQMPKEIDPGYVSDFIEKHHHDLFFQKTQDWGSEFEHRFVTTADPTQALYVEFGDALVGIIVGERFPVWERASALEIGERLGLHPYIMNWDMRSPYLGKLRLKPWPEREAGPTEKPPPEDPPRPPAP